MNERDNIDEYLLDVAKHDAERGICINDFREFKDDANYDGYYVGHGDYEKYLQYYIKFIQER